MISPPGVIQAGYVYAGYRHRRIDAGYKVTPQKLGCVSA